MEMLSKILGLLSIGGTISGINLTRKFLQSLVAILALATAGAIIAGALFVFAMFEGHAMLVRHGLDPDLAVLLTGLFGLLILACIGGAVGARFKRIEMPSFTMTQAGAAGSMAVSAIQGFLRGLGDKPRP